MKTISNHWALSQLERLARNEPDKLEVLLTKIKESLPDLYGELVLMSVESGQTSEVDAARLLDTDPVSVGMRLESFRLSVGENQLGHIVHDVHGVAKIEDKQVTVWEIVREFRRAGTVSAMRDQFPALNEVELRAALAYAGRNPDEIGGQIRAYEELVERSRAAYPFAKTSP
ncbi:MAG: DUF433 domain-containing protein [Fimbriimonadaceae bacterium]|nr:DUF433 domain-containing protein [Fimbriimonadaceae bacterium]QYK56921.1 MAG: DUF433 domain-containing protein [Fimbriimonadaceae bacterium]